MTVWISRRPDSDVAADLIASREAAGALAGVRAALAHGVDDEGVRGLSAAGAVIVGTVAATAASRPVDTGEADVLVTGERAVLWPSAAVQIIPTARAFRGRLSVAATDFALANRVMTVLACRRSGQAWPADVRLAAPPNPVVGVVTDQAHPAVEAVTAVLSRSGMRVADTEFGTDGACFIPEGMDAVIVAGSVGEADDLCAVRMVADGCPFTVLARPFDDAVAADIAAVLTHSAPATEVWPVAAMDPVELVVFGAHLRGGPLTHQLTDHGARWVGEITTAARYRMTVLATVPPKPAITRVAAGDHGSALYGHRWVMSAAVLGRFLAALPAPMQLGKVEFADGTWRTAFGCDASAATGPDISGYGSWPAAVAAGAVPGAS
jgi:allophanate hydrolase